MTGSHVGDTVEDRVARLLLERVGLRPDSTVRGRLDRAVRDELTGRGHDAATYLEHLNGSRDALQSLLNRITVQETAFFRHPEQFDAFARHVLPTLAPPVTIWSAGCANGQEPFSLAMLLAEEGVAGSVVATDLSTDALQRTRTGCYSTRELSGLSPGRRAQHLTPDQDAWQVNGAIRDRVRVLHHNLVDPPPPEVRSSQVIFCRNVLIYLSPDHIRAFLRRIAETFPPTTAFFLGGAESIWQVSDRFRAVPVGDTFVHYRAATGPHGTAAGAGRPSQGSAPARVSPARPPRGPVARGGPARTPGHAPAAATAPEPDASPGRLTRAGQDAMAAGDFATAVIAFRKCAYLAPEDPVAQLHLGLALDAAGDGLSAQRAYAAARHALRDLDPDHSVAGTEGYARAELSSLLDAKQRKVTS